MLQQEKNRNFIQWEKRFELGIPLIDKQHKQLVEICNELYTSLMNSHRTQQQNWQVAFSASLLESFHYVKEHFATEEGYLALCSFPDIREHKKLHTEFMKKVLEAVKTFETANFQTALNYVKYLANWILEHIAIEDRQYVPYFLDYVNKLPPKN